MSEKTTTNTALQEIQFELPGTYSNPEFSSEELSDDMEEMRVSFQRVKIPGGGNLQFELPGDNPEDPEYSKTLQGIIIHHHAANAYWPDGESEDENVPPVCSSTDGCTGMGEPGGACKICALNQYGSGENDRGKACKNMRHVYLLRSGDYLPILLSLPPTSLKPFMDFVSAAFIARRRASYGSLVEIGLKRMDNGNLYSVATFKKLHDFSGPQLAEVKAYTEGFKQQVKGTLKERAAESEAAPEAYESYIAGAEALNDLPEDLPFGEPEDLPFGPPVGAQPDGDLPFEVASAGAVLNGDLGQLPA